MMLVDHMLDHVLDYILDHMIINLMTKALYSCLNWYLLLAGNVCKIYLSYISNTKITKPTII